MQLLMALAAVAYVFSLNGLIKEGVEAYCPENYRDKKGEVHLFVPAGLDN
ncbi:MAG: hypothetical protein IPN76_18435 [Saprospiraceae bacterium]|nr:hypothetical protein [Saprospiraceae bacterium]